MCLNGLKCAHNARKLHFESTKFSSGNMSPKLLVKLAQITHLKSWIHPWIGNILSSERTSQQKKRLLPRNRSKAQFTESPSKSVKVNGKERHLSVTSKGHYKQLRRNRKSDGLNTSRKYFTRRSQRRQLLLRMLKKILTLALNRPLKKRSWKPLEILRMVKHPSRTSLMLSSLNVSQNL